MHRHYCESSKCCMPRRCSGHSFLLPAAGQLTHSGIRRWALARSSSSSRRRLCSSCSWTSPRPRAASHSGTAPQREAHRRGEFECLFMPHRSAPTHPSQGLQKPRWGGAGHDEISLSYTRPRAMGCLPNASPPLQGGGGVSLSLSGANFLLKKTISAPPHQGVLLHYPSQSPIQGGGGRKCPPSCQPRAAHFQEYPVKQSCFQSPRGKLSFGGPGAPPKARP